MNQPSSEQNRSSLKEACLVKIETMILSGELQAGEKLPAEREFAQRLGVSRPVVHEALVELAMKGLVSISPRHGVTVNDFHSNGSLLLLDSLLTYEHQHENSAVWQNLFDFRRLIEAEAARKASVNRSAAHIQALEAILTEEAGVDCSNVDQLTRLDFDFHVEIARVSGNMVYPLLLNSFQAAYTSYTRTFFSNNLCSPVISRVFTFHQELVTDIIQQQPDRAAETMIAMLAHGEENWKG